MLSHAGWIKSFFETWKGMLWKSGMVTHTCNPSSQWAEAENFTTTWRPGWSTWELLKEFVFHLLIYSESLCWTHCLCGGQRTTPGVSSLPPPCGFQNINSALQGCWQVPLYWANSVIPLEHSIKAKPKPKQDKTKTETQTLHPDPSLKKSGQELKKGSYIETAADAEPMEKCWLLACSPCFLI